MYIMQGINNKNARQDKSDKKIISECWVFKLIFMTHKWTRVVVGGLQHMDTWTALFIYSSDMLAVS